MVAFRSHLYWKAVEAELEIATHVGANGGEPVLRSIFSASTTSLFFMAQTFSQVW